MSIKEQVEKVRLALKDYPDVKVVAATKYMDIAQTQELIDAGVNELGESRIDTFLEKYEHFKEQDVKWHFFGGFHKQKVRDIRFICNKIECFHSLDNSALATELNKRLENTLDCFVQVNICENSLNAGVPVNRVLAFVKQMEEYSKIKVIGLMCIAPMTYDNELIKRSFNKMRELRDEISNMNLPYAPCTELSMGMSNDYKLAVECGATQLRLGRIFLK